MRKPLAATEKRLDERLEIPVTTSSAASRQFRRPPVSLGSGAVFAVRARGAKFLGEADVIRGYRLFVHRDKFGVAMPKGKTIIHSTWTPHLNKCRGQGRACRDAAWRLRAAEETAKDRTSDRDASGRRAAEIAPRIRNGWRMDAELTSKKGRASQFLSRARICSAPSTSGTPISPMTRQPARSASSRSGGGVEQLSSISAAGKTKQLGYGLGLAMGAKLAKTRTALHQRLGAIAANRVHRQGFRTAVRRAYPDLSVLLNQFQHGDELKVDADLDRKI